MVEVCKMQIISKTIIFIRVFDFTNESITASTSIASLAKSNDGDGFISTGIINQFEISIILALVMAFSFQPILAYIEKATDKIFFKGNYNSNELLSKLTKI